MGDDTEQVEVNVRNWPIRQRFEYLNKVLRAGETEHPITSVVVDGYEEGSAIVLMRNGGRSIVFHGAQAMLSPTRMQAIVGAVLRRSIPRFKSETLDKIADIVWSLATMRNIYDSVDSATDYGRSYLYSATSALNTLDETDRRPSFDELEPTHKWTVFDTLKTAESNAEVSGAAPTSVIPYTDGQQLVIRPWFHAHVQRDLGHEGLSEQRIASLMGMAGWVSLPTARSAITVHNPADNAVSLQFRFYVVPKDWELSLDTEGDAP